MRSVLLTGATSFPGRALCELLRDDNIEVHALVRPASQVAELTAIGVIPHTVDGSAGAVAAAVREAAPDVTFHLANVYLREADPGDIARMIEVNITLGTVLIQALVSQGHPHFVNVGTFAQFLDSPTPRPLNLYAATKEAFETILAYYRDIGLRATTVVLYDTYGPGDTRSKLITGLLAGLRDGRSMSLPAEDVTMDFLYRTDAAAAIAHAGRGLLADPADWEGRRFSATGTRHSIRHAVAELESISGLTLNANWGGWATPARSIRLPWLGETVPGWHAATTLHAGLRRTWEDTHHAG